MHIGINSSLFTANPTWGSSPLVPTQSPSGSKYSPVTTSSKSSDQETPWNVLETRERISMEEYNADLYRLMDVYRDMIMNQRFVGGGGGGGIVDHLIKPGKAFDLNDSTILKTDMDRATPMRRAPSPDNLTHNHIVYNLHPQLVGPQLKCLDYLLSRPALWTTASRLINLSPKLFLGGVPTHNNCVTLQMQNDLVKGLGRFGSVKVVWPREIQVVPDTSLSIAMAMLSLNRADSRRGHCYAIFENSASMLLLLSACHRRPKGFYIDLGSSDPKLGHRKLNSIQVIPWDQNDVEYPSSQELAENQTKRFFATDSQYLKPTKFKLKQYSVFVGALHGMLTSRALYTIFNDLFGNVYQASLDTDAHKYPIGSGRVTFTSPKSYLEAVKTNFILVECPYFKKLIQIDPYLEDAICSKCLRSLGVYFCRHTECFDYFCPKCWFAYHSTDLNQHHKPLRRSINPKSVYNPHV